MTSISDDLQSKPKWYNCQQSWSKQASGEVKRVEVLLKGEQKKQSNLICLEKVRAISLLSIAPN
ncbi:hypothetical protein [Nostoc sp. NZL]|uniref:hypothetical protein n=1 Tax=Nostoc sp. NZL TaxID=2650612 RepID=UPI0018C7D441|nr:hypothetical protein [Nostoc sp. NZL]MBG1245018.1 hypothetical protein [Nostoc sp. NZL]